MIVSIIDYGSGNLRSAAKAFERAISEAELQMVVNITADPDLIAGSDRIVLPGVGAFGDCKKGLESIPGMLEAIEKAVLRLGRPFFGICVGMQLMGKFGLEHGVTRGFGWVDAKVEALAPSDKKLKIPHMGWNELNFTMPRHPILADIAPHEHAYFVHSYHIICRQTSDIVAYVNHGGEITAAIGRDNMFGTQFHPEKSQKIGLQIIKNFLSWCP